MCHYPFNQKMKNILEHHTKGELLDHWIKTNIFLCLIVIFALTIICNLPENDAH